MLLCRNAVHGTVINVVLVVTPPDCFVVEVGQFCKDAANHEIFLNKANQAFNASLCEWVAGLAKLRAEAKIAHKQLIILLPDRMALIIPADNNTFHVVRKDMLRNAHIQECMNYADKQVLLPCIREEFNIAVSTAMADHGKAGELVFLTPLRFYLDESPVHLVGFARIGLVSPATVSLRCHDLTLGWNQVLMGRYVTLDDGQTSLEPKLFQPVIDD